MIRHISHHQLGQFDNDWLRSRFHFNFSGVTAPMGGMFGPLRVWNDDEIQPGTGFDMHGHRDMEIITYVRRGAISHRDSLGNEGRTAAGDVQVMSAGTGIFHAEFNQEPQVTELFQIWLTPNRIGLPPRWAQMSFPQADRAGRWVPLASGEAHIQGALPIHQDATLYGAYLETGNRLSHPLAANRRAYLVPAAGRLRVNGTELEVREGLAIQAVGQLEIEALKPAEILLFDLP